MKWNECRATRREIDQAEANQQLSAQALAHLGLCAECDAFQSERMRLRELLLSLEPVTAPADFDFRLRARITAQGNGGTSRFRFGTFVLNTRAITAAVIFAVLALSIAWFVQRGANRTQNTASSQPKRTNLAASENSTEGNKEDTRTPVKSGGEEESVDEPQRRAPIKVGGSPKSGSAKDFSVSRAQSIKRGQPRDGELSVTAPLKPMVLSFEDDKGATRTFSLPPVSFGSQRLLEGRTVPVSMNNAKNTPRVW